MTSIPSDQLKYKPLLGSEIRLLKIKPNNGSGPLECQLDHYELEPEANGSSSESETRPVIQELFKKRKPRYHALSYVWGSQSETVPIIVNGCQLNVGQNLYDALFRIQKMFRSGSYQRIGDRDNGTRPLYMDLANSCRLIWVDAICINQEDVDEKSRQVPRMNVIYRDAADVIVWLGEPAEKDIPELERWIKAIPILCHLEEVNLQQSDMPQKLQVLCSMATQQSIQATRRIEAVTRHIFPPVIYEAYLNGTLEEVLKEGDFHECSKALFAGMEIFMSNEWFSRIWTVQEALLARGSGLCNMLIGDMRTTMLSIAAIKIMVDMFSDRLQTRIYHRFTAVMGLSNLYQWFDVDHFLLEVDEVTLAHRLNDVIRLAKNRKAGYPHDHIYGLLGLINSASLPSHLRPDYSRPFEQVWHEYIMFIVEKTGDLNRLCCSGRTLNGVPDWVPDLRLIGKTLKTPLEDSFVSFSEDGQKLNAIGVQLGTILDLFTIKTDRKWDFEDSRYWDSATMATYDSCAEQLHNLNKTIISRAKELRSCTDEVIFRSVASGGWQSEWDIRDRYTDLQDLLKPRLSIDDGRETNEEEQRRVDCIALAKWLSSGPILLTDTGLIVQDQREGERSHVHEDDPDMHLSDGDDILCVLMGSNWPWWLRRSGLEYTLVGDTCAIIQEGERIIYGAEYYEDKDVEEFIIV
jgi:hypothetical protein